MQLNVTSPSSPYEWQQYFALRWRVLRAPWQQPPGSEQDSLEEHAIHKMIVDQNNHIVAVGRLHHLNLTQAQIRYMAVAPEVRQQGYGTRILHALEQTAKAAAINHIVLNARESALEFYLRQGYQIVAPADTMFDSIIHWRMEKHLT